MPQILLEEYQLSVRAPRGLPESEYRAMHRILGDRKFQALLRRAVAAVFRQYAALAKVHLTLTR